jgi:hypothetical protein
LRREEEMDVAGEGGEARDLGGAGGIAMVTDDVEDGVCGAEGEEQSRVGAQTEQTRGGGRITERSHIYVPGFFLRFLLFRSRDMKLLVRQLYIYMY